MRGGVTEREREGERGRPVGGGGGGYFFRSLTQRELVRHWHTRCHLTFTRLGFPNPFKRLEMSVS